MKHSFAKIYRISFSVIMVSLLVMALMSWQSTQSVYCKIQNDLKANIVGLKNVRTLEFEIMELQISFNETYAERSTDISHPIEHLDAIRSILKTFDFSALSQSEFKPVLAKNERQCRTLLYAYGATYFDDPSRDFGAESLQKIRDIMAESREDVVYHCRVMETQIDATIGDLLIGLDHAKTRMYLSLFGGVFLVVAMVWLINRALKLKLTRIIAEAESIGRGEVGRRINSPFRDMLGRVALTIDVMADRIERTQNELKSTNQTLLESLEEAKKADVAKSEFLANMSHEIRTPMNAIIGFTDILKETDLSEEQSEFITLVNDSAYNLLQIINDILDFSKIESQKIELDTAEYPLGQITSYVGALLNQSAEQKGIEFEIHQSGSLPEYIETDGTRVRQCLINLIGNAIKFTNEGYVHLDVSLEMADSQEYVCFAVRDSGIGIEPDKLEKIFEAFCQADGSTSRKYGGTGLGLSITKKLTEALGGSLTVESESGQGSVFTMRIPLRVSSVPQMSAV